MIKIRLNWTDTLTDHKKTRKSSHVRHKNPESFQIRNKWLYVMSLQCNLPQIDPVKTVSIKSKYGAEFRRFAIQPSDQAKNLANNSSVNSSTNNSPLTNSNHNNSNNLDNSINPLHSTSTEFFLKRYPIFDPIFDLNF